MEFRHLRTFAKAAELSSFTRAAEALAITQAAVSQHVGALEKELGVQLFDRTGRRVLITVAGERLFDYAQRILQLVDEAVREFERHDESVSGGVRIAASTVPAESLLPGLLADFRRRYPLVRETVTVTDSRDAANAVATAQADVGFVGAKPDSPELQHRAIAVDELVLVAPPHHRLARNKTATLADIRNEPLIVREPGSGSRRCLEEALGGLGISLRDLTIAMEVNSNDAIRAAVRRDVGLAFLSAGTVKQEIDEGNIVPLRVRGLRARRYLYVLHPKQEGRSEAVEKFITFLDARFHDV